MSECEFERPQADKAPVLAATWWSFGRDRLLLNRAISELEECRARIHDTWTDPDLNRTLIAFTGEHGDVAHCLCALSDALLPSIDLRRHTGTHPRTGALDVIRLTPLSNDVSGRSALDTFGEFVAKEHRLAVFADGPDSDAASERRILDLREGGFGTLEGKVLDPDFGPPVAHERYGVTTVHVGPLQLQAVLELADTSCKAATAVADVLNGFRAEGDPMLLGVHADGFAQPTNGGSLLMLTFEMPDENWPDEILKVAEREARLLGAGPGRARALGMWRLSKLGKATRLTLDERKQVWNDVFI